MSIEEMKDASIRRIVGPTILMGSGTYFDYERPDLTPLTIEDVAFGLAFTCRFRGQCVRRDTGQRVFYSVAEHCVRMSWVIPSHAAYDALMHELGEVACGDMPGPIKPLCPDYKAIEKRCEAAAMEQFGVTMADPELVKLYDLRMLSTEKRDLTRSEGDKWAHTGEAEPFDFKIVPWETRFAAEIFLMRYRELRP